MPGMKPSASLTSISSMDKDATLGSLTQFARRISPSGSEGQRFGEKPIVVELGHAEHERRPKSQQAQKKKRKRRHLITANLSGTRYEVVRQAAEHIGFSVTKEDDPSSYLFWNDCFVSTERISELKPYQRINHFPGMGELTRKDCLARNMIKVQKGHPDELQFVPKTWILPADYSLLQNYAKDLKVKKSAKTFIVKPANGAQGHGIQLFRNAEKISPTEHFIVQEYVDKPLLLDGYKFDLRIYVLVTSCDPLRVFLYNDGLVRMSTEKYLPPQDNNLNHLYMHLTNYSVNKHNKFYEKGDSVDSGSKRSIHFFNDYLRKMDYDVAHLWRNISDMIVKAMLVVQPHLLHAYRMCRPGAAAGSDSVCFELLGFDVLIDRKLRPWLLEINRSPSFGTDEKIDYDIKSSLIEDTLKLLNIKLSDKSRNIKAQKAEAQRRLFRPTKRTEVGDITEFDKRKLGVEKRKEELKETLARMRKAAAREEFENRNSGRFRRIFPCDDRARHEKACNLMSSIFGIFMSGRAGAMQKEIQRVYMNKLKEEDILDMLAECEAEEKGSYPGGKGMRGPKPLQSMPTVSLQQEDHVTDEDEEESDDGTSPSGTPLMARRASALGMGRTRSSAGMQRPESGTSSTLNSRPNSGASGIQQATGSRSARPQSNTSLSGQRSRSMSRLTNSGVKATPLQRSAVDDNFLISVVKEREDELTKKTLTALNDMRIKFPGKSDQEAELILDRLHENWKFHKPRIASYWLVKLDSIKRRKVIDIVRSNVRAVLQRTWRCSDIDSLRLYRIFSRVFNRLLWSHGQGLWNCFSTSGNASSWETIFSKSSENVSDMELNSCRRIVQLCRDCLLIVYQFAAEAKTPIQQSTTQQGPGNTDDATNIQNGASTRDKSALMPLTQTMSQRYSKLYQQPPPDTLIS